MDSHNPDASIPGSASRRRFLQHTALTGATAVAGSALPALAQDGKVARKPTLAKGQMPMAETLARYAMALKYENLPPDVVRVAKRTILDTIGCAIGGYKAGPSQIAVKLAGNVGAKNAATVICSGTKTSPDLAAFADGVMIRYLDFNDGYIAVGTGGHPSDMIAALLPVAEVAGRSGRDLILGTVLTHEVFCKVSDVQNTRGLGLDHSTVTGLAAVVGVARLMGLSERQFVHAIGIEVGGNTAINQGRVGDLSNWKAFASAEACRKAIFAAQLAEAGMTGPEPVFEGRDGFFNVILREPFRLPKLGGPDAPYGIMHAFTKRFPLGQYAQTVAQAAVESRQYFKDPPEIQEINLKVSHNAIIVMADTPDKWQPQTHETADHSIPYSTGVALMYGTITDEYYEGQYLHDKRLLDLVSRVKCIHSPEADRVENEFNLCELELVLKSGDRKNVRVEYHRGHWKNPMTDLEMEEKFRLLARRQLPAARIDALLKQLWSLEDVSNIGALVEMTRI
jgi:2-methylcitrate dehydratase